MAHREKVLVFSPSLKFHFGLVTMIFKFTYTNVIYVLLYFHWSRRLCALHWASTGVNWKPLFENVVMHSESQKPTISGIKFHSPRGHYLVTTLLTRSQSDPGLKVDIVCFRKWILKNGLLKKKVSNSKFLYLKLWQILHNSFIFGYQDMINGLCNLP